ncbi:MAG: DUF4388 domain-containing protein [Acidobacteria bacterium]|nr:DUF4388 domain-containing protein [Acidobacteriota bacterium]
MPKSEARVLLVDDNPLIVDLMRRGLEPLAETSSSTDAEAALRQCQQSPPDLLICDYRMPRLDGSQLVQKLKENPATENVRIIMVAAKADIDEKLRPMAGVVEEFLVKPFYVRDLAAHAQKVLEKIAWEKMQKQGPAEGVIRGRLSEMNLIDLLQSMELGQKTCLLTLNQGEKNCRMYFSEGQIRHAESGSIVGDEAVYQVAGWSDGSFEIDFNARSEQQTTTRSTQGLLMEALRLLDEQNR